jgi:hypothetical protein
MVTIPFIRRPSRVAGEGRVLCALDIALARQLMRIPSLLFVPELSQTGQPTFVAIGGPSLHSKFMVPHQLWTA